MKFLISSIVAVILATSFSGCFLPDDKYAALKHDYIQIRSEVIKNWDTYPPQVKRAFIRIDNALTAYDRARGGVLKPLTERMNIVHNTLHRQSAANSNSSNQINK